MCIKRSWVCVTKQCCTHAGIFFIQPTFDDPDGELQMTEHASI